MERDDWFVTASGRRVFVRSPDPEQICIEDIAHGLSHLCRFGGQTSHFYSVAQHSVLVSELVPREHARIGLMHDASEAYLGDVIGPLKRHMGGLYREFERLWGFAIAERFGLPTQEPMCVKTADLVALVTERRDLVPAAQRWGWKVDECGLTPDPRPIVPWEPRVARAAFLTRWEELRQ